MKGGSEGCVGVSREEGGMSGSGSGTGKEQIFSWKEPTGGNGSLKIKLNGSIIKCTK